MLPRQDRFLNVAAASLVVLASSAQAKSKGSSQKTSKPISTGGGGGSTCYDSEYVHPTWFGYPLNFMIPHSGNQITCPLSKTEYIVIGVIGGQPIISLESRQQNPYRALGIVFIIVFASVLCCIVRKKRQGFASKKKDTKGEHQKVPSKDPLYDNEANPYDPDEKHLGEMVEGEKPHYSTPYDPVYPTQQYDHQFSDSASIASSVYNVPPVTVAQPQDYSNQYYYNTNITAPPRMYAPTPHHPSNDM